MATLSVPTNSTTQIIVQTSDYASGAGEKYSFYATGSSTTGTNQGGEAGCFEWYHGKAGFSASTATTATTTQASGGWDNTNGDGGFFCFDVEQGVSCAGTGSFFAVGNVVGGVMDTSLTTNTAMQTVHLRGPSSGTTSKVEKMHTIWANGRHAVAGKFNAAFGANNVFPESNVRGAYDATGTNVASGVLAAWGHAGTNLGVLVAMADTAFDSTVGPYVASGGFSMDGANGQNPAAISSGAKHNAGLLVSGYENWPTAVRAKAFMNDLRLHSGTNALTVTTGTKAATITDAYGTASTALTDGFDPQRGAWVISAASNHVNLGGATAATWGIDGTNVTARFSPCFIIGSYSSANNPILTLGTTTLVKGTDYECWVDTTNNILYVALLFDKGTGGVRTSTNSGAVSTYSALDIIAPVLISQQEASSAGHSNTNTSLSWSFTTAAGDDLLIVGVASTNNSGNADVISGVTYNGVSMTYIDGYPTNQPGNTIIGLYYLVNPAIGANTVAVTCTAAGSQPDIIAGAISLKGCNTSSPIVQSTHNELTSGSTTSATATLNGTVNGNMLLALCATGSGVSSASTGTLSWSKNVSTQTSGDNAGASYYATPGGNVTMGFNITADWFFMAAVEIAAATGASGPPQVSGTLAVTGSSTHTLSGTPAVMGTLGVQGVTVATLAPTALGTLPVQGVSTHSLAGVPNVAGSLVVTGVSTHTLTGTPTVLGATSVLGVSTHTLTGTLAVMGTLSPLGVSTHTLAGIPTAMGTLSVTGVSTHSLAGTPMAMGTLSVLGTSTHSLTGTVGSAGGPPTVSGATAVLGVSTHSLTGTPMVMGSISVLGVSTATLAGTPAVMGAISVLGVSTHTFSGTSMVMGTTRLLGVSTHSLAGVPAVMGAVAVMGVTTATLAGTPAVLGTVAVLGVSTHSLAGVPNVAGSTAVLGVSTHSLSGTVGSAGGPPTVSGATAVLGVATASLVGTPMVMGTLAVLGVTTSALGGTPTLLGSLAVLGVAVHSLSGVKAVAGTLVVLGVSTASLGGTPGVAGTLGILGVSTHSLFGSPAVMGTLGVLGTGLIGFTAGPPAISGTLSVLGSGIAGLAGVAGAQASVAVLGQGVASLSGVSTVMGALSVLGQGFVSTVVALQGAFPVLGQATHLLSGVVVLPPSFSGLVQPGALLAAYVAFPLPLRRDTITAQGAPVSTVTADTQGAYLLRGLFAGQAYHIQVTPPQDDPYWMTWRVANAAMQAATCTLYSSAGPLGRAPGGTVLIEPVGSALQVEPLRLTPNGAGAWSATLFAATTYRVRWGTAAWEGVLPAVGSVSLSAWIALPSTIRLLP